MKVIFMGTPDFAVPTLDALFKEHDVELVVTQTDKPKGRGKTLTPPPVKARALELGIEVYQPEDINSTESIEKIQGIDPDVIVVVAYGQILKEEILNCPTHKCINVHASLLPKYRGAAPLNWVVIKGECKTGTTIMEMDRGLDSGDMLSTCEMTIDEDMTAGDVHDQMMHEGSDLLIETLKNIESGNIERTPQDHDESTYAPIMDKKLGKIDWNTDAEDIKNLVRGTCPWPSAYFNYNDKNVKVLEVEVCDTLASGIPGSIVKVSNEGIVVNTKDKCVVLKKIQFPCKKPVTIEDYLRGNEFDCDIILG